MDSGVSITRVLKSFEREWLTAPPASIESHLGNSSGQHRRVLLLELVCVDMEYRWRGNVDSLATGDAGRSTDSTLAATRLVAGDATLPAPLLVDDYLRQFPELGDPSSVDALLIEEEFRVRNRWGDRPDVASVVGRFPAHAEILTTRLREIRSEFDDSSGSDGEQQGDSLSIEELLVRIAESRLCSADELAALRDQLHDAGPFPDGCRAGEWLVQARRLTEGQLKLLVKGLTCPLVLGTYEILDELGAGGMGQVFKALHRGMNREVALKTLKSSLPATSDSLQRFQREVQVAARLVHPNVVVAHDAGEVDGVRYLVMEYVEGQTLSALVRNSDPLPVRHAADIIQQAAEGLRYAHQRGVIHRDVKPGNLLLGEDGVVKVLDLGLARLNVSEDDSISNDSDPLTSASMVMGTADYMAPEQALETRSADERADIYSLGCTLYFLLTGQRVFPAGTVWQTISFHHSNQIPSLRVLRSDVPCDLDAVYQKMLAKDVSDRYQSMPDVIEALTRFTAGPAGELSSDSSAQDAIGLSNVGLPDQHTPAHSSLRESTTDALDAARRDSTAASDPATDATLLLPSRRQSHAGKRGQQIAAGMVLIAAIALVGWKLGPANAPTADEASVSVPVESGSIPEEAHPDAAAERNELIARNWSTADEAERQRLRATLREMPSPGDSLLVEQIPNNELIDAARYDEFLHEHLVAVLGSSRGRHWNRVNTVAFTSDSQQLITGSDDGTVAIRDASTGETQHVIELPSHVKDLSLSPDGGTLAVGLFDGSVELLDTQSWERLQNKSLGSGYTYRVLFSPAGKWLAVSTLSKVQIQNRSTNEWQPLPESGAASELAFCPGNLLAVAQGTASSDLKVYDLETGLMLRRLPGSVSLVLLTTPDETRLVARRDDGRLVIWNTESWDELPAPELTGVDQLALHPTEPGLAVVCFSPDSDAASFVSVINLSTGLVKRSLKMPVRTRVLACAFSPNGRRLAIGSQAGAVTLWDAESWTSLDQQPDARHWGSIHDIDVRRSGDRLASASNEGTVALWELSTGELVSLTRDGSRKSGAVAFSTAEDWLAYCSNKGGISRLNVRDGSPASAAMLPATDLRINTLAAGGKPEGLFAGLHDGRILELDPLTRSIRRQFVVSSSGGNVSSLAFSRSFDRLLAATEPGYGNSPPAVVRLFDLEDSVTAGDATSSNDAGSAGESVPGNWTRSGFPPVAFSADEQSVVSGDNYNGFLISPLSAPANAQKLAHREFGNGEFRTESQSVAVSPLDGTIVMGYSNGSLSVWSPDGQWRRRFRIGPAGGRVHDLTFTPDGRYLITANGNGTIYVLRVFGTNAAPHGLW